MSRNKLKIFSGNSNIDFAKKVCESIAEPLGEGIPTYFQNGNVKVDIGENVREADVYIIQTECESVNDHLVELLLMIQACRLASAKKITAVIPNYFYARQDRKDKPRVPISASAVAQMLISVGVDHIMTMDLHSRQIQGFFGNCPVDNLYASPVLIPIIAKRFEGKNLVIVSPDAGGVPRARAYANRLNARLAFINKYKPEGTEIEQMDLVGQICDYAIILDDMIDTGGTQIKAAEAIIKAGAKNVETFVTHGIFSGDAIARIDASLIERITFTDTVPMKPEAGSLPKFQQVSVAPLIGQAIKLSHEGESISNLFKINF